VPLGGVPVTAARLSDWLRQSGALPSGAVAEMRVDLELETSISTLVFVDVTYVGGVPADLPRRLVVKSPQVKGVALSDTGAEARFYQHVAPGIGAPPLVRCLAVAKDDGGVLVLEDLRATHDNPLWPLPPTRVQCERALEALVRVHEAWWESPMLGHGVGDLHTAESLTAMVGGIAAHLPGFLDALGDRITSEGRRVYERVFGSSLKPWLRLVDRRGLTVVHGDAHTWNFLFPREGDGPALLIDWQLWHLDVGARDLAFLMALHWHPGRRRELELALLRHYYRGLVAHGIEDYGFDQLMLDYRRCVVRNLTLPIIFWNRGMKPEGWWHRLECALAAYADLGCEELI
jgi:phosphotransferase family enzyme